MNKKSNDNYWVSLSDIMTGLMVIFLFIAISYIVEVQKEQNARDELFAEFQLTKENLYNELNEKFKDDFQDWKVELDKNLSIKFTNPDVLFRFGSNQIEPKFMAILDEFLPKYFDIILQDKYRERIAEIRIEGHTDMAPVKNTPDPYIGNVILSQQRSAEVLKYFRNMPYYKKLSDINKQQLLFWLTANGLSYGKTLDDNKQLTAVSKMPVNNAYSRRVEFRIVTTSESLVEKVIEQLE
ncbi:MAG: OmpA family protein [Deferribacteraceae bacterium]|jgi:outer membrane protein OmpA-like peptidoglycan-associated protein|nr:OmpA family protein [Deferribacteraceae bacterium]